VALAAAKVVAESVAGAAGESSLTREQAFDFIYAEFVKDGENMLPLIEREIARRALAAAAGDAMVAAKVIGLTKAALQKLLKD
jgi:hypothetical protein